MKARSAMINLAPLRDYWQTIGAKGRSNLVVWGAVALFLILMFAVWLPLQQRHAAIEGRLPALEASRITMLAQAEDVKRLRALPPTAGSQKQVDLGSLKNSFAGAEVTALGNGRYRVVMNEGRFGAWLAGLRSLNGALVIGELKVERLPGAGERVKIEASLQAPGAVAPAGAGK